AILPRRHRPEHFGRDHQIVALRHLAEPSPGDLLADADRVNVRSVEEVDSRLERDAEMLARLVHLEHPVSPLLGPITHASETDARDAHSGFAKFCVLHDY